MNKIQNVQCKISFGGYGRYLLADTKTATALFQLLASCQVVDNEWNKSTGSVPVVQENSVSMVLTTEVPMSRAEYEAMREAADAEEAAKEAAEAGVMSQEELDELTKKIHRK
jgi:hypothetical protein